ncbi:MAG: ferrous iron transport protein B [Anaerolineales bacterium]|nr:ferrous iron transport protein B [Anaerolineales bacterium]
MITYTPELESEIDLLRDVIARQPVIAARYPQRWLAIQLLEADDSLWAEMPAAERQALETAVAAGQARLQQQFGEDADLALTDARYAFVHGLTAQVLAAPGHALSPSDRIDRLVTNRWLGVPIFLALMYLVFSLVQRVSAPYLDWVDGVIGGPVTGWLAWLLAQLSAPGWLASLLIDGVLAGVGGVLTFLPGLLVMYLALAVLEDSGYLARAAFVMDRGMSRLGLHGRSFVPMILGFGCNVPAIYATRTIESRGARVLTGLLIPFMSCSARLPVYVVFSLALFPRYASVVIWSLYLVGILVAAGVGLILARTLFADEPAGILLMEMPAYRLPSPKRVAQYTWHESAAFVRKAGSFILVGTVVFWLLLHLPWGTTDARQSAFGRASAAVAPALAPAGFGEWETAGALLTGVLAKEMVVSTLAQVYVGEAAAEEEEGTAVGDLNVLADLRDIAAGFGAATLAAGRQLLETLTPGVTLFPAAAEGSDTALTAALRQAFTPLSAVALLVFVLLYVPCLATVGAQIQEYGWRWALLSVGITLVVPWLLATLVYQGGRLLGWGV